MTRVLIDLTSLVNWRGPPVGIIRVQHEYALYARRNVPGVVFTIFDARIDRYRPIRDQFVDAVLAGRMKPHLGFYPPPGDTKKRFVKLVPRALREPYFWVARFRRKLLLKAESRRLKASPANSARWAAVQERLMQPRLRRMLFDQNGGRIDVPALDDVLGPPKDAAKDDLRVGIQFDWTHTAIRPTLDERDRTGSRYVALCHDIIPLLFPQWYENHDVDSFRRHFNQVFARADDLITSSRSNSHDVRVYCEAGGIRPPPAAVVPLGAPPVDLSQANALLPDGLVAGKFALFVSTIEPRKNHAMLVEAWRTLVREGTIARTGFSLVFVGRDGWMMGDFIATITADPELAGTVVRLKNISDATLNSLYDGAAFCLYPPLYEGFGLPPLEALQRGKAQIVSSSGPMPEVVGDFAVCLDPRDQKAWTDRMRAWIEGASERSDLQARVAAQFKAMTWEQSAKLFFDTVLSRHEAALAAQSSTTASASISTR